MKNLKQKGHIELVLIIILLVIIGAAGLYILNRSKDQNADNKTSSSTSKKYCFVSDRVCITAAPGWKVRTTPSEAFPEHPLIGPHDDVEVAWAVDSTITEKVFYDNDCATTSQCYGTLVSTTPLPNDSSLLAAQIVYTMQSSDNSLINSAWEYVVSQQHLADSGLVLGQTVKVGKSIKPSFPVPVEFNLAKDMLLGAHYFCDLKNAAIPLSIEQAKACFTSKDGSEAHEILLSTTVNRTVPN